MGRRRSAPGRSPTAARTPRSGPPDRLRPTTMAARLTQSQPDDPAPATPAAAYAGIAARAAGADVTTPAGQAHPPLAARRRTHAPSLPPPVARQFFRATPSRPPQNWPGSLATSAGGSGRQSWMDTSAEVDQAPGDVVGEDLSVGGSQWPSVTRWRSQSWLGRLPGWPLDGYRLDRSSGSTARAHG